MTTTQDVLRRVPLAAFLAIAAFFLLTEHRAHLYGALPFLLLLACPLLHVVGHGGHGGHGGRDEAERGDDAEGDIHAGHNRPRGRMT